MAVQQARGRIEVVSGPMFSGKTSYIIRLIERYLISKKKVVAIKWKGDVRYSDKNVIITHNGRSCESHAMNNETLNLPDEDADVVVIDEGQFFKDIVNFSETLANQGKIVIVAALLGTFERKGFNDILNLLPKVEKITFLDAICDFCHEEGAAFSKRVIDNDDVELVGSDIYKACCRKCW
jgi:thymidine kinase